MIKHFSTVGKCPIRMEGFKMMELTINGDVYGFNFGFGFMRELDDKVQIPVDDIPGKKEKIGMRYEILQMLNGSVTSLVNILCAANKGQNPRLTRGAIEEFLEGPDVDIDVIFDDVKDFLLKANVTKKETKKLIEAIEGTETAEAADKGMETKTADEQYL